MLTHVNYRTGRMHDMAALTARRARRRRADGVGPRALGRRGAGGPERGADADFAVGCGYKYLNGGPGAPAFVWVHPRMPSASGSRCPAGWAMRRRSSSRPTTGRPPGIARYLCGTPPVLSLAALECGVDTVLAAEPLRRHGARCARSRWR